MKRFNNSASFALMLCLLVTMFIVSGAYNALAAPQMLPFDFFPGIGQLEWRNIGENTCNGGDSSLNIRDAVSADGSSDAYDGAFHTFVDATPVISDGIGDLTGNTYTSATQNISGLDVTYQLFFSEDTQCSRLVLFFDNNLGFPISDTVRIETEFGSDDDTTIEGTSSGDNTFTIADRWLVTSEDGTGDPVNTSVFYGTGNPTSTPTSASLTGCGQVDEGFSVTYDVTVPERSTRCLMLFACLGDFTGTANTISGALADAPLFNSNDTIPGDLLSGLSETQLTECSNWDFGNPPPPRPSPVPTLSEWGLIAMAAILGIVGFMVIRRRKVTA